MDVAARILTIEDEPAIRHGIVAFMEDSGFEMLEADNGETGLEMFRMNQPDLVLCDLRLPGLDGLDVLSAISEEAPETPVIIVSGAGMVGDAVQAIKRGAWDFVTKPIADMEVLESSVRRGLERADLLRQNRAYKETLESLNRDLVEALKQFEEDQEAGRKIQFQLLPQDKLRFGDFTLTRRLYPSTYLSGDFVDYAPIDRTRLAFYMADVSGHGAASAFVTVMLRTLTTQYLEAYRRDGDDTMLCPDKTLARLDHDLRRQKLDKHVTIFYGVIDCSREILHYCNAGHFPYPVICDAEGVRSLVCRGRPVGLFEDSRYTASEIPIPAVCTLLLASDGVLELVPENDGQDKQVFLEAQLTQEHAGIDWLASRLGLDTGVQLPDDVALLLIDRKAS
jgi:phosphoserine phosphatase RsbU/P